MAHSQFSLSRFHFGTEHIAHATRKLVRSKPASRHHHTNVEIALRVAGQLGESSLDVLFD